MYIFFLWSLKWIKLFLAWWHFNFSVRWIIVNILFFLWSMKCIKLFLAYSSDYYKLNISFGWMLMNKYFFMSDIDKMFIHFSTIMKFSCQYFHNSKVYTVHKSLCIYYLEFINYLLIWILIHYFSEWIVNKLYIWIFIYFIAFYA